MKKIRLGLVRYSDIHGYYYGVMLDECAPMLLLEKYYIVHYYASHIYDPRKLTIPRVPGFEIANVWDYDSARAEVILKNFKRMIETGKPPVPSRNFLVHIGVIAAAARAQKAGQRVFLKDVI